MAAVFTHPRVDVFCARMSDGRWIGTVTSLGKLLGEFVARSPDEIVREVTLAFSIRESFALDVASSSPDKQHWTTGRLRKRCPECRGTGKYIGLVEIDDCSECRGSGKVPA